ncbi:MAG: hypothetical protein ACRCUP_00190 [Mycoplasmatales bacterium]
MSTQTNRLLQDTEISPEIQSEAELQATNQVESDLIKNRPTTLETDSKKSIRDTYGVELFQSKPQKIEYDTEISQLFTTEKQQKQPVAETKLLFQNEGSYTITKTNQELATPTFVYVIAAFILAAIAIKLALIDWKGLRHEKKSNNDD